MFSIFIAIVTFLVVFFGQLYLVRIFRMLHIHTFISFVIHIIGFTIVVFLVLPINELLYTSILIYILLTILLATFSFVPLLGVHSPTSIILIMLQKKQATLAQLQSAVDEKHLILRRIEDLINVGLVQKRKDTYIVSPLGLFIAWLILTLSRLMGLKDQS